MKYILLPLLVLFCHLGLNATWSIVVLDSTTHTIGIAGASCTYNVYGIGRFMSGQGVIISQAYGNREAGTEALKMIHHEEPPSSILNQIATSEFDNELHNRQYAVVTFAHYDSPVTFTGDSIRDASVNAFTAPGISVQGNSLANEKVLYNVFKAVVQARERGDSMEDILMAGLEVGSRNGGDGRCGDQTARSAFLVVAGPEDVDCSYLDIRVIGIDKGGSNAVHHVKENVSILKKRLSKHKCTELLIVPKD